MRSYYTLMGSVAEVQAGDIHAGLQKFKDLLVVVDRWSEGTYNLGALVHGTSLPGFLPSHRFASSFNEAHPSILSRYKNTRQTMVW